MNSILWEKLRNFISLIIRYAFKVNYVEHFVAQMYLFFPSSKDPYIKYKSIYVNLTWEESCKYDTLGNDEHNEESDEVPSLNSEIVVQTVW